MIPLPIGVTAGMSEAQNTTHGGTLSTSKGEVREAAIEADDSSMVPLSGYGASVERDGGRSAA